MTIRPYLFLGLGFALGLIIATTAIWQSAPGMMLQERTSPLSLDDTVQAITASAESAGWTVAGVNPLDDKIRKHGGGDLPPIRLINICQAQHAHAILREEANRPVSVMMPCTIAVYQRDNGEVAIANLNAGLMGKMFGGTIAHVMGGAVADDQQTFIEAALSAGN